MTEASGGPPRAWTTDTIRRVHGWTDPTKPAPIASRTAILQLSTRRLGRSANRVSTTKRASVRVSFIGGSGPPHSREDFVRRSQQEPVADQLVELDAEIVVAFGHHLVLPPLLIGAILRAEMWRAQPD